MKRSILSAFSALALACAPLAAKAADLPLAPFMTKAPPLASMTWSGCYIGGSAGYGWTGHAWNLFASPGTPMPAAATDPAVSQATGSGFTGGGQVGCDIQIGASWVVGIEASWTGNAISASAAQLAATAGYRVDWDAALVAKLGFVPMPGWMVYALGGLAGGDITANAAVNCLVSPQFCGSTGFSNVHAGWTVGAGIEHAFNQYLSGRIEYRHVDLGSQSLFLPGGAPGIGFTASTIATIDKVMAGVNIRF